VRKDIQREFGIRKQYFFLSIVLARRLYSKGSIYLSLKYFVSSTF
jgi:hypothetical protein